MMKVVTDFVETPAILVLCDASCSEVSRWTPPAGMENIKAQQAFASALALQGWYIGFDAQICPKHLAAQRESENRVQLAQSMPSQKLKLVV